jgi:hypothetical protein
MSTAMILFIIGIHIVALLLVFWFLRVLPKIWLVSRPSNKTVLFGFGIAYSIASILVIIIHIHGKKYPPPNALPNNYYEGKFKYLDSGKTPRDVGSVILVYGQDGKRKKVECYTPTLNELKMGALPCGYDDLAYEALDGKTGKVWYYNDFSKNNPLDGRFYTRYIAIKLVIDTPLKVYPFEAQSNVIRHYIEEVENNPFKLPNILDAFLFLICFFAIFYFYTLDKIRKENI